MESNLAPESSIWLPGSNVILWSSLCNLIMLFFSFIGFHPNCSKKLNILDTVLKFILLFEWFSNINFSCYTPILIWLSFLQPFSKKFIKSSLEFIWFIDYSSHFIVPMISPAEFFTGLFLIFSIWWLLIILSSDIKPATATSAARLAPSTILTAKADFCSGIIAIKTPSAPFLKNTFSLDSLVKMEFILWLPPAISGNYTQELKIL